MSRSRLAVVFARFSEISRTRSEAVASCGPEVSISSRALTAAARTSTTVALSSVTSSDALCIVPGSVAALFSMLASVAVIDLMFSSESIADARPTRSGRLARN
jgi:hypothetical protein